MGMLNTRIMGPVRGYYVAAFAAKMGDLGDSFLGTWRIFPHEPDDFLARGHVAAGECPQRVASISGALDAAVDAAFEAVNSMLPGPAAPARTDAGLASLIYVSHAARKLSAADVSYMVERARTRNVEYGITGYLLFFDEKFMQYVEGPRAHLELIYHHIRRDSSHHNITELMREQIGRRVFDQWTMAFDTPDELRRVGAEFGGPWKLPRDHAEAVNAMLSFFARREHEDQRAAVQR